MATQVKSEQKPEREAEVPKYSLGTRVRKFFEGSGWFTGKVSCYDGKNYHVVYDDGDSEDYDQDELESIVLSKDLEKVVIGSRVAVYRPEEDQYFEATVTRERIDRKPLFLEYDNGDRKWTDLRQHNFILLEERARRRSRLRHNQDASSKKSKISRESKKGNVTKAQAGLQGESSSSSSSGVEDIVVGSRVAVYRPIYDKYYEATVTKERDGENPLYLEYVCGIREWTDLRQRDFIHLEEQRPQRGIQCKEMKDETASKRESESESKSVTQSPNRQCKKEMKDETAPKSETESESTSLARTPDLKAENNMEAQSIFFPTKESEEGETKSACNDGKGPARKGTSRAQALRVKTEESDTRAKSSSPLPSNGVKKQAKSTRMLSPELEKVDVGSRVAVYNPEEDQYLEAVVTHKRFIKPPFHLHYVRGKREWTDLRRHDFILLEEQPRRRGRRSNGVQDTSSPKRSTVVSKGSGESSGKGKKRQRTPPKGKSKKGSAGNSLKGNKRQRIEGKKRGAKTMTSKGGDKLSSAASSEKKAGKSVHKKQKVSSGKKVSGSVDDKPKYDVGTKVKKFFEGHGWFSGRVSSFDGHFYEVVYDDGDSEEYNEKELSAIVVSHDLAKVEIGSRIAVMWPADDKYYEATVVRERITSKKPYYLEYDTGHYEWIDLNGTKFYLLGGGTRRRSDTEVDDGSDSDIGANSDVVIGSGAESSDALQLAVEESDGSVSDSEFWKG